MTAFSDDFNRANSTSSLGSPWVANSGTWGINSNQAYQSGTGGDLDATVDTGAADGILEVTLATIPASLTNTRPGLIFWYQNASNFFLFQANPGGYWVLKVAGGATIIPGVSVTPASGDVIKVVLSGHTIDMYLNGVKRNTVTDATFATATKHGLYTSSSDTTSRFDDFSFAPLSLARGWVVGAVTLN